MKRFVLLAILVCAASTAACQEPDPNYGDPNGIVGKKLPHETVAPTGSGTVNVPAPTTTLKAAHASATGVAAGAPLDKVTDCLACHMAGAPKAPQFAFGGRVEAGGVGDPDVVVTVTGLGPVKSDADGYFWQKTGTVAASSNVSIAKGAATKTMGGTLAAGTGGGCGAGGGCHTGPQGAIHL